MTGARGHATDVDVAIIGDGPAGAALAAACVAAGADTVLLGRGAPWTNTYAVWCDEVPRLPSTVFATTSERVVVWGERRHEFDRVYGVIDNAELRSHLLDDVSVVRAEVTDAGRGVVRFDSGELAAHSIVDATGVGSFCGSDRRAAAKAFQSAFGVLVDEVPSDADIDRGAVTMMDFRPIEHGGPTTFLYAIPVSSGWLLEETELAARTPAAPEVLRRRLAARVGAEVVDRAVECGRSETVSIAMGGAVPRIDGDVIPFGSAAGYVHPATGYSVAASLGAAGRVAAALVEQGDVASAIWPSAARRSRAFHDYGLDALLRLSSSEIRQFFDAFFDLSLDQWPAYMRVDTTPAAVAEVMRGVFANVGWSTRAKLMAGNPGPLLRLLS